MILDAHSNYLSPGTVKMDNQGFVAMVDSGENYPLTTYVGFLIKPGHTSLVSLSAKRISATDDLRRSLSPLKRKCYFNDENQGPIL